MSGNLVITIGRECGSGGRRIGQMLAEKLGIKCYDKELLALAAKNSGLCKELFETHDEKPTQQFFIFPGHGYVFHRIFRFRLHGYAHQPQGLPGTV